jgi:hypothetical protein
MVFWLVRAVMYKTSICKRYLSLASWGNLGGIHATVWYLTIYPFQLRGKRPTRVILEKHGCKFTHVNRRKTDVCVCVCVLRYNRLTVVIFFGPSCVTYLWFIGHQYGTKAANTKTEWIIEWQDTKTDTQAADSIQAWYTMWLYYKWLLANHWQLQVSKKPQATLHNEGKLIAVFIWLPVSIVL